MSLFSAIGSAVSGLTAQSTSLSNISNNIANASTVGYKQSDTDFESLVFGSDAGGTSAPGGVAASSNVEVTTGGQLQSTGVNTDLAITGNGFMVVTPSSTATDGNYLLTRAGSFRPDANGNLVNAAGYYLQGQPLTSVGPVAAPSTMSSLATVNISNLSATGSSTSSMTFNANLPSSETAYAATPPSPSTSSMTYYDALGGAQSLQFQFTPTVAATAGAPNTNTWTMNIFDSASTTPTTPIGTATLTFNATGANAGSLASVTPSTGTYNGTAGTFTVTTASGQTLPINIGALNSASGMTQLDSTYQTTQLGQNGAGFGVLQGVSIGNGGLVTASFSNGTTRPIYQINLVTVPNADGLTAVSGDAFKLSNASGAPMLNNPGQGSAGTITGGSLEGSNVDLTTQLTNMIETQRAYSSNAMVVQTSSQMLDTINHLNA
ncbi:MAG: flagellar hook protein FlgE [Alphaproteobacteria bacterium]|nr:flagellar hook protein FlgE [Alphaproteobacteria bacterium]